MLCLTLDFGGSSVKGAIIDGGANIVERFRLPSRVANFDILLSTLDPYVKRYREQFELSGIAISACGAVDVDTGYIHGQSSLSYIHGHNVKQLFNLRYGIPVEIENDACCAGLAESWQGEARHSKHFCVAVIGSGVGGAIVTNGIIQKGHQLHGGEFGCAIMGFENGRPQVLSNLASTRALIDQAARVLDVPRDTLDGVKVFEHYDQGNKDVIDVVQTWVGYLATGLFNLQYTVDPEYIVLGGAISQREDLVTLLNDRFEQYIEMMPYCHVIPKVLASTFGNDANLIGALRHFLNRV